MTALGRLCASRASPRPPVSTTYLEEVEAALDAPAVEPSHHAVVVAGIVGATSALAAGGKRLRPALAFLSSSPERRPAGRGGCRGRARAHGDARPRRPHRRSPVRRGRAAAWSEHGEQAAKAAGDYLFARAFSVLAETGDGERGRRARRCLARPRARRGDAAPAAPRPRHDVEDYLERCALKTGALFEAACVLGGGSGEYGRLLGIAFQIADDVLDCTGETIETGKVPGTDLRDGTPTLPLLLAAQRGPRRARGPRRRPEGRRRSSGSPRAVRSSGPASWRSTTLRRPGPASTAPRAGTSSRR